MQRLRDHSLASRKRFTLVKSLFVVKNSTYAINGLAFTLNSCLCKALSSKILYPLYQSVVSRHSVWNTWSRKTMRRSKRCVTSKYKKNTAEKQKITKTDNVVPDEEQKQSTKESIENTDQIEKQDTLTKQELATSSSDDVTSKQGSAAGGRTDEGSMIEAKTEPRREMPDFFFQDEDGDT